VNEEALVHWGMLRHKQTNKNHLKQLTAFYEHLYFTGFVRISAEQTRAHTADWRVISITADDFLGLCHQQFLPIWVLVLPVGCGARVYVPNLCPVIIYKLIQHNAHRSPNALVA
jgi:hypothetical protein